MICIGYLACLYVSVYLLVDGVVAMVTLVVAAGLLVISPRVSTSSVLCRHSASLIPFDSAPQIAGMLGTLSTRAGLGRVPALYRIPFESHNVFAVGRPGNSVIAISDGVLRILSFREIAAVLAHELGHIVHRDTQVTGLSELLRRSLKAIRSLVLVVASINAVVWLSGNQTLAWDGLALLFMGAVILLYWVDLPLHNREFDADAAAVALTQDPEALISALQKIDGALAQEDGGALFSNDRPVHQAQRSESHPQIEQRLARLLSLSSNIASSVKTGCGTGLADSHSVNGSTY